MRCRRSMPRFDYPPTRATWGARCGKSARRVLRGGTGTSDLVASLVPTHHDPIVRNGLRVHGVLVGRDVRCKGCLCQTVLGRCLTALRVLSNEPRATRKQSASQPASMLISSLLAGQRPTTALLHHSCGSYQFST